MDCWARWIMSLVLKTKVCVIATAGSNPAQSV